MTYESNFTQEELDSARTVSAMTIANTYEEAIIILSGVSSKKELDNVAKKISEIPYLSENFVEEWLLMLKSDIRASSNKDYFTYEHVKALETRSAKASTPFELAWLHYAEADVMDISVSKLMELTQPDNSCGSFTYINEEFTYVE